jgi:hypothetical protein
MSRQLVIACIAAALATVPAFRPAAVPAAEAQAICTARADGLDTSRYDAFANDPLMVPVLVRVRCSRASGPRRRLGILFRSAAVEPASERSLVNDADGKSRLHYRICAGERGGCDRLVGDGNDGAPPFTSLDSPFADEGDHTMYVYVLVAPHQDIRVGAYHARLAIETLLY